MPCLRPEDQVNRATLSVYLFDTRHPALTSTSREKSRTMVLANVRAAVRGILRLAGKIRVIDSRSTSGST